MIKSLIKPFSTLLLLLASFVVVSCGDSDDPQPPRPVNPDPEEETFSLKVAGATSFGQESKTLKFTVTPDRSTNYKIGVKGEHDWIFLAPKTDDDGYFVKDRPVEVELYANRRGVSSGRHTCTLVFQTEEGNFDVPVSIDIDRFVPYGGYRKVATCDPRYEVTFAGCWKRNGYVNLQYFIKNNGEDVKSLKFWANPYYSWMYDEGMTFNVESGSMESWLGTQSGIGDLMTPVASGQTITAGHVVYVGSYAPTKELGGHFATYNYGTGDWQCAGKVISFEGLDCEDLDNFNPNYTPIAPEDPKPKFSLEVVGSTSFGPTDKSITFSIKPDRDIDYIATISATSNFAWFSSETNVEGTFKKDTPVDITLYATRRGVEAGKHTCTIDIATADGSVAIPVTIEIDRFVPYGSCKEIKSCDPRYEVTFAGCFKSQGKLYINYNIKNNGNDVKQLKYWTNRHYTWLNDGVVGFNIESGHNMYSIFGSQSGTGDLMTPIANGQTISVSHRFDVGDYLPTKKLGGPISIYNYGTGDWQCSGKVIYFEGLDCEDLDNFNPDYQPIY